MEKIVITGALVDVSKGCIANSGMAMIEPEDREHSCMVDMLKESELRTLRKMLDRKVTLTIAPAEDE